MNSVALVGRLTRDPELRQTKTGTPVCSFTVAVDRRFRDKDGNRQADFISCVAWNKAAEIVGQYFTKGARIALNGSIQTRQYEAQDGSKRTAVEVIADTVEFVEKREQAPAAAPQQFAETDDDIPF